MPRDPDFPEAFPIGRAAASGLLAMLVGVGVARFGYTPLIPVLTGGHWLSASQAFWLGAVNLLGYLIGAGGMRAWPGHVEARGATLVLMALTTFSLFVSAPHLADLPAEIAWLGVWRLVSGITGGCLMVLIGAAVVGRAPRATRGQVSGIAFAGMGGGITLCGIVLPALATHGVSIAWAGYGALGLAATVAVFFLMPPGAVAPAPKGAAFRLPPRPVAMIVIAYAFCAVGFVPHVLFWSGYIALGLGRGVGAGAFFAALMGLAATIGPPLGGRLADKIGFRNVLLLAYVLLVGGVALPVVAHGPVALGASSILVGGLALGMVAFTSAAIAERVPPAMLAATWGLATITYAVVQASVAAGFSALFHATGNYALLYGIGACANAIAALFVLLA